MQDILAFLALTLPLTLSPGPASIALSGLGMSNGLLRSMPFYLGSVISVFVLSAAGGMGLNELFLGNAVIYHGIRYAGIVYILYLALKFIRARPPELREGKSSHSLYDGMLLTALNPKFYVMVTIVFSQFLRPGQDTVWLLIAGFTAAIAGSSFVWLVAGASLRPLLRSEKAFRLQSIAFGILLLLVPLFMVLK